MQVRANDSSPARSAICNQHNHPSTERTEIIRKSIENFFITVANTSPLYLPTFTARSYLLIFKNGIAVSFSLLVSHAKLIRFAEYLSRLSSLRSPPEQQKKLRPANDLQFEDSVLFAENLKRAQPRFDAGASKIPWRTRLGKFKK